MYCYFSQPEAKFVVKKYKYKEAVIVDSVKLCSNDNGTSAKNRACISFRVPRSKHGMFFYFRVLCTYHFREFVLSEEYLGTKNTIYSSRNINVFFY
jgi:hypothetical protein